jgi:hypothetical protein
LVENKSLRRQILVIYDLSNIISQRLFDVKITSKYNVTIRSYFGRFLVLFRPQKLHFWRPFHMKKNLQIWVIWTSKMTSKRQNFGWETMLKRRLLDVFVLLVNISTGKQCLILLSVVSDPNTMNSVFAGFSLSLTLFISFCMSCI